MSKKFKVFERKNIIYESILEIDNKDLSSPKEFISFMQFHLDQCYHVVIERAKYDNMLYSTNLCIFVSHDIDATSNCQTKLCCYNSTLTKCSLNKLLKNYTKLTKSNEILLLIGLQNVTLKCECVKDPYAERCILFS